MATAIICVVAALVVGVVAGWLLTRNAPSVTPALPDPVVLQTYAARRAALQKDAPSVQPLSISDAAIALRNLAK
jgi:hypothetical protein